MNMICVVMLFKLHAIKTHGSELQGTKHMPKQKYNHYCESFTSWNGFAIFQNLHGEISDLRKGHKTFVLVLYTTQSFRPVCAIAC